MLEMGVTLDFGQLVMDNEFAGGTSICRCHANGHRSSGAPYSAGSSGKEAGNCGDRNRSGRYPRYRQTHRGDDVGGLEVYGFEVHDLGRDVPIEKFIEKTKEVNADIVAASALMTTTMVGQKLLEEALQEAGIREKVKLMVGGAAVTQDWADQIGADGYAEEVTAAVTKAKKIIQSSS
jgi:hypothetical protein